MKAGKRLIFTGILIYPLAMLMCLMLVRSARSPLTADHLLMLALYLVLTFPMAVIVVGMLLLQKNR
ncbi:MAG TPA: hypothetical protein VMD75_13625 [Candidatus Binataceae bacterium]|nr:hypothetical protein [Candidatus Binataceae bacterium]